jgi:hypothetical protein
MQNEEGAMNRRTSRLWLGPLVVFLIAGAAALQEGIIRAGQDVEVLEGPETWVPFSAEFTVTDQNDRVTTRGREYRASDGSRRSESFAPHLKDPAITIINLSQMKVYLVRPPETTWSAHPLGDRPTPSAKIGLRGPLVRNTFEGFEVVEQTQHGERRVLVPALNFFELVSEADLNGQRSVRRVTKIVREEPSPALFVPPVDAIIVERPEPHGFLRQIPRRGAR